MTGNPLLNAIGGAFVLYTGVRWCRSSQPDELPKPKLPISQAAALAPPPRMMTVKTTSQSRDIHAPGGTQEPERTHEVHVQVVQPGDELLHKFDHTQCKEAAALGLPSDQAVRCYGGYLASLNYERRIPNWVLEALNYNRIRKHDHAASPPKTEGKPQQQSTTSAPATEDESQAAPPVSRQRSVFFADKSVDEPFRVTPKMYEQSGYWGISRGHLAAAQFHTGSQSELDATFNMNANIVPQDMSLNALDWFRLEQLTRRLTRAVQKGQHRGEYVDENAKLYVASGPAFLPTRSNTADGQLQMIHDVLEVKNQIVAVPTHLYKVIVSERCEKPGADPEYRSAAFLMPNQAIPEERRLTDYQVPIATLESLTGLRFFPKVDPTTLQDLCLRFKCEVASSPFSQLYRPIAQLRSAMSVPDLRARYHEIVHHAENQGQKLNSEIEREYQKRLNALVAAAVKPVESV